MWFSSRLTFGWVEVVPPVKAIASWPGLVVEQFGVDWSSIPDGRGGMTPREQHVVGSIGPLAKQWALPGQPFNALTQDVLRH